MKKDKKFSLLLREYFVFYGIIPAFSISILLLAFVIFFQQFSFRRDIRIFNRESAQALEGALGKQELFLHDFASSPELQAYLSHEENAAALYQQFYDFNRNTDLKSVLNILDADGNIISSTIRLSDDYSKTRIRMIAERIRRQSPEVLKESNLLEYPSGNLSVYTLGTAVVDGTGTVTGYILIQILEEGIQQVIKPEGMLRQITVDKFDRIISTQNDLEHGLKEQFRPESIENEFYYSKTNLAEFDITIYTAGTKNPFLSSYIVAILFSVVVLVHLIILVNRISARVSRRVTEPIHNLVQAFSHLKSGETEYITDRSNIEEFHFLTEEYNNMLKQLNRLMHRNAELSEIRRIAEIKQLEAQFDPHFFLNMLEILRYMSLMSQEEAEKMIFSLSGILRYSLYNKDQFSSVKDDIKYVEDYLYLQKTRIGSNFSYSIVIDESVNEMIIPKMLIQPLVENSVKHGYQGVPDFCVKISLFKKDGDLILVVSDNGKGISKDKALKLMELLGQEGSGDHIGLFNVHKRLEYMYGDGYGVQEIDGSEGFCVTVRMKGEENGDDLSGSCGGG